MKAHTYSQCLLEDLEDIPCEATPDNFRRLLNILGNALGELARHERAIAALNVNANSASCLANGIRPD